MSIHQSFTPSKAPAALGSSICLPDQIPDITATPAWNALLRHHDEIGGKHLREFFDDDPARGRELVLTVGDLYVDYSKHRVTRETLQLLIDLAKAADLEGRRDAMFAGEHINTSEDRAVLHTALRLPKGAELTVDGQDVVADVHEVLDSMGEFTDRLRSGEWTGATGERIKTVVNIGIGGSDLGPVMVYQALRHYADAGISARFVSNVDPADLVAKLDGLDPATTLFIVASKTFSTLETLTNATAARRWLIDGTRRGRGVQALRRGVHQREAGRRVRHRHRQHVRLLGLGRWPLLGGLRDRAVGDGGDRQGAVRRVPRRLPRRRRALPHHAAGGECACAAWPHRPLVQRLLRRAVPRRAAVLQRPVALRGVSAAADDGVQRQVGATRRHPGQRRDRRNLLGRAGNQRPARVLPVAAPGHPADPRRLHRVLPAHRRPAHPRRHRQHARPA